MDEAVQGLKDRLVQAIKDLNIDQHEERSSNI